MEELGGFYVIALTRPCSIPDRHPAFPSRRYGTLALNAPQTDLSIQHDATLDSTSPQSLLKLQSRSISHHRPSFLLGQEASSTIPSGSTAIQPGDSNSIADAAIERHAECHLILLLFALHLLPSSHPSLDDTRLDRCCRPSTTQPHRVRSLRTDVLALSPRLSLPTSLKTAPLPSYKHEQCLLPRSPPK